MAEYQLQPVWADDPQDGLDAALALCKSEPGRELVAAREMGMWTSSKFRQTIKERAKQHHGGKFISRTRPAQDKMMKVDVLVKWMPDNKD